MTKPKIFTFGRPEPVWGNNVYGNNMLVFNGKYYEPLIMHFILLQLLKASVHHESALNVKVNLLVRDFIPNKIINRQTFRGLAWDFLFSGNAYLELQQNIYGTPISGKRSMAINTRVGKEDQFYFIDAFYQPHLFINPVLHIKEIDLTQDIYGRPTYLSAMESIALNEQATLFRVKYYKNGSHMGYILYVSDAVDEETSKAIEGALEESKNDGNFGNLYINLPNGKVDGIRIIPIAEISAKDEFLNIKNITAKDVMTAHRIPPQMLGQVPDTNGGFGSVRDASDIYFQNEIIPLQSKMLEFNELVGQEIIRFKPPIIINPSSTN